jgi:hypothetical protein
MENNNFEHYCNNCKYGTNYKTNYDKHCKTKLHERHGEKKINIFKCDLCDFECKLKSDCNAHKISKHTTIKEKEEKSKHYCKCCNFGTIRKAMMKRRRNI